MVSFRSLLTSALFAVAVVAQEPSSNFTSADIQTLLNMQGPNSPDAGTRVSWCRGQTSLCGVLCNGDNRNNHCDSDSLNWTCACSNGSTPGLQYYPYSIIGNECHALNGNCKAANANNAAGQDQCDKTYVCGNATSDDATKAAAAANSQSTMSTMTASGSAAPATSTPAPTSHNAAPASYQVYGPGMAAMMILGAIGAAL